WRKKFQQIFHEGRSSKRGGTTLVAVCDAELQQVVGPLSIRAVENHYDFKNLLELKILRRSSSRELRIFLFFRLDGLPHVGRHQVAKVAELRSSLEPFATVHDDLLAVDVAAFIAHQESCQVSQFFMSSKPSEWIALLCQLFQRLDRHQPRECAFRWNGPRSNGIEADAERAPLDGEAARKVQDPGFRHRRGHNVWRATLGIHGGDIEHAGVMPSLEPAFAAGHSAMNGSHQNDSDHSFKRADGEVFSA